MALKTDGTECTAHTVTHVLVGILEADLTEGGEIWSDGIKMQALDPACHPRKRSLLGLACLSWCCQQQWWWHQTQANHLECTAAAPQAHQPPRSESSPSTTSLRSKVTTRQWHLLGGSSTQRKPGLQHVSPGVPWHWQSLEVCTSYWPPCKARSSDAWCQVHPRRLWHPGGGHTSQGRWATTQLDNGCWLISHMGYYCSGVYQMQGKPSWQ